MTTSFASVPDAPRHFSSTPGEAELAAVEMNVAERLAVIDARLERLTLAERLLEAAEQEVARLREMLAETPQESLEDELKATKRKYRRAQNDAQQARSEVAQLRGRLAQVEGELARLKRSGPVRFAAALHAVPARLAGLVPGGGKRAVRLRQRRERDLIRASSLFDAEWYRAAYPDIAHAGIDPASHYLADGWRETRDPGPNFSTSGYLKANPDVAAQGGNPLVHYIVHGIGEGRAIGVGPARKMQLVVEDFGPAFPCAQFEVRNDEPIRWRRHYDIAAHTSASARVGDRVVGTVDPGAAAWFGAIRDRFLRLSGLSTVGADEGMTPSRCPPIALLDCWFNGGYQLRMRVEAQGINCPTVMRAVQRDPGSEAVLIVGEGLVRDSLDVIDLSLLNPLFPVLLVSTGIEGDLIGARILPFPSLCRGGLHYAEMLSATRAGSDPQDWLSVAERLATTLETVLGGERAVPLVKSLQIDLRGADGTEGIFQPALQDWLTQILRIDLAAAPIPAAMADASGAYLAQSASATARAGGRAQGGVELVLPSDCIPTISVLTATSPAAAGMRAGAEAQAAVLVAERDPAKPVVAIVPPAGHDSIVADMTANANMCFPLFTGVGDAAGLPLAAIRSADRRQIAEARLLVPVAQPAEFAGAVDLSGRRVKVLLSPGAWNEQGLVTTLASLAAQRGGLEIALVLVGAVAKLGASAANAFFPGCWTAIDSPDAATDLVGDDPVLHVGAGITLHDDRTLSTLLALLENEKVASASCAIVESARHGLDWSIKPFDMGQTWHAGEGATTRPLVTLADVMWQTTVPVAAPPRDFWLARPSLLRRDTLPHGAMHLCCTLLSVSYLAPGEAPADDAGDHPRLPQAEPERALRIEVLVG